MATSVQTKNLKKTTKTVLVNSRERDFSKYPSPGSYVIDLPRTYNNVIGAHMASAEVPFSFYSFTAALGNTTLNLDVNGTTRSITIPDGTYSFSSVSTALASALNTAFSVETYVFGVSVSPETGKLTIQCTNLPASTTLRIDNTTGPDWGLAYFLGFPNDMVTVGATNTGTLTGHNVCVLNPYTYLVLDIQELNGTDHVGVSGGNSAFGKIPLNLPSINFVLYDKVLSKQTFNPPRLQVNKLHVSFKFPDGNPVDFQGAEHSFTIELVCTDEKMVSRSY